MNEAIELMRARAAAPVQVRRLTEAQCLRVVADIRATVPLVDMVEHIDLSPASAADRDLVLDFIADYGTWIKHVTKDGKKAQTQPWYASGDLFPELEDTRQRNLAARKRRQRDQAEQAGQVLPPVVTLPKGFERTKGSKRDVAASLANVCVSDPATDVDMVRRYLARKYPVRSAVLTLGMLGSVWRFAQLGRLDEIDRVNEKKDRALDQVLVAAYDTLEVARQDAVEAVTALTSAEVADLDAVAAAAVRARWVAPAEMARIERAIGVARERGTDAALKLLADELRWLAGRVRESERLKTRYTEAHAAAVAAWAPRKRTHDYLVWLNELAEQYVAMATADAARFYADGLIAKAADASRQARVARQEIPPVPVLAAKPVLRRPDVDYLPADIAALTEPQVRAIAVAAGVSVEAFNRADEKDIRAKIAAYGFRADMDQLLPQGVRAFMNGQIEVFWSALEARASGDPDWQDQLTELTEATPVPAGAVAVA